MRIFQKCKSQLIARSLLRVPVQSDLTPHPGSLSLPRTPLSQLGWTALHKAAENEDVEMMEYLLDRGANINALNPVRP